MAKLVRIVSNHSSGMFGIDPENEVISILPLISESATTITFHAPNGNKFSANILKKETNAGYFVSYYVDSVMQIYEDDK